MKPSDLDTAFPALVPEVIAGMVTPDPVVREALCARARTHWERTPGFRRSFRGHDERDQLRMWMEHWLAGMQPREAKRKPTRSLSARDPQPSALVLLRKTLETRIHKHTYLPRCWRDTDCHGMMIDGLSVVFHLHHRHHGTRHRVMAYLLAMDGTTAKPLSMEKIKELICKLESECESRI